MSSGDKLRFSENWPVSVQEHPGHRFNTIIKSLVYINAPLLGDFTSILQVGLNQRQWNNVQTVKTHKATGSCFFEKSTDWFSIYYCTKCWHPFIVLKSRNPAIMSLNWNMSNSLLFTLHNTVDQAGTSPPPSNDLILLSVPTCTISGLPSIHLCGALMGGAWWK